MLPTITVYCPICGRKVMNATTIGSMPIKGKCKFCLKMIIYHPDTNKIKIDEMPIRKEASGKVIY